MPEQRTAIQVDGLTGATRVAVGRGHACALLANLTATCWGDNSDGQLGDGTNTDRPMAGMAVMGLTNADQITAGDAFTCAHSTTTGVMCWGADQQGQLGDDSRAMSQNVATPVQPPLGNLVSAGDAHACAVGEPSGGARCWGDNADRQIGSGTMDQFVPVAVVGLP
jgi:alpha-tubulin suppressor-like RCC1 family protein